jgi:hypothetical protein
MAPLAHVRIIGSRPGQVKDTRREFIIASHCLDTFLISGRADAVLAAIGTWATRQQVRISSHVRP